jgi:hypothetical protein
MGEKFEFPVPPTLAYLECGACLALKEAPPADAAYILGAGEFFLIGKEKILSSLCPTHRQWFNELMKAHATGAKTATLTKLVSVKGKKSGG